MCLHFSYDDFTSSIIHAVTNLAPTGVDISNWTFIYSGSLFNFDANIEEIKKCVDRNQIILEQYFLLNK